LSHPKLGPLSIGPPGDPKGQRVEEVPGAQQATDGPQGEARALLEEVADVWEPRVGNNTWMVMVLMG